MRNLIFLTGAALAVAMTPAAAEAKPKSAKAHVNAGGYIDTDRKSGGNWRDQRRADVNGNGILDYRERRRVDINRNGIADWRERSIDRNRDGIDDRNQAMMNRWGNAACPPGLAKKHNGCLPPGQAKRMFREGQRVPNGYNYYTDYSNIPVQYRNQYNLDPNSRYIYRNNQIYVVDPRTSLIQRIIGSLL